MLRACSLQTADVFPVVAFPSTGIMDFVMACPRLLLQKTLFMYDLSIYIFFLLSRDKKINKKEQDLKYDRSLDYTDNSLSGSVIV